MQRFLEIWAINEDPLIEWIRFGWKWHSAGNRTVNLLALDNFANMKIFAARDSNT